MSESAAQTPDKTADERAQETNELGMHLFLGTEVLLFGAMFIVYAVLRRHHNAGFEEAGHHAHLILGTLNTVVLLASSLLVALADVRFGGKKGTKRLLNGAILLATLFLAIKGVEYYKTYAAGHLPGFNFHYDGPHAPAVELYYFLYFVMTGFHAAHVIGGLAMWCWLRARLQSSMPEPKWNRWLSITALYWHFVDIVWVFLYPLFYLLGR